VGLRRDRGLEANRSSLLMTMWTSSAEKSNGLGLLLVGICVSTQSGKAGSNLDVDFGRCFMGGVATREDDAADAADELDEDRLSVRGEGGGSVSRDCIAGEAGRGGTSVGLRCLGVDWGLLRDCR